MDIFSLAGQVAYQASALIQNDIAYIILTLFMASFVAFSGKGNAKRLFYILSALLVGLVISYALKNAFALPRPCALGQSSLIQCPSDYSLPSIHATLAFIIALAALGSKRFHPAFFWALLVSASRVYLGVHSGIDIIAAIAVAVLSVSIIDALEVHEPVLSHKKRLGESERKTGHNEYARQFVHAMAGSAVLAYAYFFGTQNAAIMVAWILLCGLILFDLKAKETRLKIVDPLLSYLERPDSPPGFGALAYFAGMLFCLAFFSRDIALSMLFVLAICDAASTVAGKAFGKTKLPYNKEKSLAGTAAFALFALPAYFIGGMPALFAGLLATLIESLPLKVNDNLLIPLAGLITLIL